MGEKIGNGMSLNSRNAAFSMSTYTSSRRNRTGWLPTASDVALTIPAELPPDPESYHEGD